MIFEDNTFILKLFESKLILRSSHNNHVNLNNNKQFLKILMIFDNTWVSFYALFYFGNLFISAFWDNIKSFFLIVNSLKLHKNFDEFCDDSFL